MRSGGRRRRRRHSRILFESQRVGALPGTASFAATAQRVVVRRRDAVLGAHAEVLGGALEATQAKYDKMLEAAEAWDSRWHGLLADLSRPDGEPAEEDPTVRMEVRV